MITDGRAVPTGRLRSADVCIVGAGPAGIAVALELADRGIGVLLIESGGVDPDAEAQVLARGENAGRPYYPLESTRIRGFAGSAAAWEIEALGSRVWARFAPLRELDFERREWVPYSGWPFSRRVLEPYYRRAHDLLGLGPVAYDASAATPPPSFRTVELPGPHFAPALFRLGSRHRLTIDLRRAVELHPRIDLIQHATVVSLTTDADGHQVTHVDVATLRGNRFAAAAKVFVLAAGGIDNARLLLVSDQVHRNGLGNHHDLVGRFFMEHPHLLTGIVVPDDGRDLLLPGYSDVFEADGVPVYRAFELTEATLRREGLLGYGFRFSPEPWTAATRYLASLPDSSDGLASLRALARACRTGQRPPGGTSSHLLRVLRHLDDVARAAFARLRWARAPRDLADGEPGFFGLYVMAEQAPDPESRVVVSERVDALGARLLDPRCRQARLVWRLSDLDADSLVRAQALLRDTLHRAGLGRVHVRLYPGAPLDRVHGGYHHMGTTRMHADPRRGVVDPDCRVHSVPNLFIAGTSVFPTAGYVNPTLAMVALALRTADRIAREVTSPAELPESTSSVVSPHLDGERRSEGKR